MTVSRRARTLSLATAAIAVIALFLPAGAPEYVAPSDATPFRWDADTLFAQLESSFAGARALDPAQAEAAIEALESEGRGILVELERASTTPTDLLHRLATLQFELAVQGAAHPTLMPRAERFLIAARVATMTAAGRWPADRSTHEVLYRVVFGGRIAMEEALVQAGAVLPSIVPIEDVPSETPYLEVEGVRIHSGDILLSRGGAPTSALIARGSDFANTFSHAALAHVDPETGVGTVVESLIETGTVLTTVEEYLRDKKHRILVLRLRPDHPALVADAQLPHRAATAMLERLRSNHADYDFAMDWQDPTRMFCSEVVYHAYGAQGVELWPIRSAMTTPGLVRWLAGMGVREFRTLVPSDLEYDAQLRAVLEWRDLEALSDYRLDNAVTDALLEAADEGADLGYAPPALALGRLAKGASVLASMVGIDPIIPRGMSAPAALRVDALVSTVSPALRSTITARLAAFEAAEGYPAPYWTLVGFARDALADQREALIPALR